MTLPQFPILPGIGWDIKKTPITSTRVLAASSGVEYRAQNWASPRFRYELPINFMRQRLAYTEWNTLQGFILSQAGMFANWLYSDPSSNAVTNQLIGAGDGVITAFPLVVAVGGYSMPVNYVNVVQNVYVNGTLVDPADYTITQSGYYGPDTVTFGSAPTGNVSADFTYFFICRFDTDEPEFTEFITNIWSNDGLTFESVK